MSNEASCCGDRRCIDDSAVHVCPAQQTVATNTSAAVPPLVNFSGVLTDVNGRPLTEITGVTFYLYKDQQGGAPLWMAAQNVHPDADGHYTVLLGSTKSDGLPTDLFASGQARWLAVQVQGQDEQSRVLLLSVPYALKAADAATLGGLPASAFVQSDAAAGPMESGSSKPAPTQSNTLSAESAATISGVVITGASEETVEVLTAPRQGGPMTIGCIGVHD